MRRCSNTFPFRFSPRGGTAPASADGTDRVAPIPTAPMIAASAIWMATASMRSSSNGIPPIPRTTRKAGYTGPVYLDAYKLDGTRLWRINLGKNIRAGAHYTQFMVYDLDGDGKAEVACKTAPGTVDGQGKNVLMPEQMIPASCTRTRTATS